jgi:hypothetical protein
MDWPQALSGTILHLTFSRLSVSPSSQRPLHSIIDSSRHSKLCGPKALADRAFIKQARLIHSLA